MTENLITDPFLIRLKALIDGNPDLTASGLAIKAGLDNSTIRNMFARGYKSTRISTARKICTALGTTYEEFMGSAQTSEEQEIVRLISQLSEPDRQRLLGFGQGLADKQALALPKPDEDGQ